MKLSSFERVRDLVDARQCLQAQRHGAIEHDISVVVRMDGFAHRLSSPGSMSYHEATMSTAVREAVVVELDRRLAINAEALQAAGVQVEA